MPVLLLKLSPPIVAVHALLPYKFARTISTTSAAAISTRNCSAVVAHRRVPRRIEAPCVPLTLSAHDKVPCMKLGLRGGGCGGQKAFYSSEDRAGSGGAMVSKDDKQQGDDQWPPSPPSINRFSDGHLTAEPHQLQSAKLLTLPTILTIGRVAAVPLLVGTFYVDNWWGTTATTSIFIAAAITDWLDGYIARKMRLSSAFGAFLDPVADKLMVAATLVLLCTKPMEVPFFGQSPWLLTVPAIAIIGREITMSAVREWAASQNNNLSEAVAVNNLGKWKTATQMTALTILLAARDSSLSGGVVVASGAVLLYISAWLAVWSLVVYMRKIWKVLLK